MAKSGEQFKTEHGVFDAFTYQTLFKLIADRHFLGLTSPISIGKESNVFAARTGSGGFVAVKIYRLETCDFNRMYEYIKFDPRFIGLLRKRRKVIFTWAQREYRNLLLAREAGVTSPLPIAVRNNVLVESFIGDDSPAPRLVRAAPRDPQAFFSDLVKNIGKFYRAGMTHGDLSPFNILNYHNTPVLIDFSQGTTKENPRFQELFERDVKIVVKHFVKLGLELDSAQIINSIMAGKKI